MNTPEATAVTERPPENAAVSGSSALPPEELTQLTDGIVAAIKTVYDPEIPADIYELGLIYRIDIADDRAVAIDMSLTSSAVSVNCFWNCSKDAKCCSMRWSNTPAGLPAAFGLRQFQ